MQDQSYKTKILNYLAEFVTEHKRALMDNALKQRTRYLTVVLEDVYQAHNASAVVRSCDSFGIQDVYAIEKRHAFNTTNAISRGAAQWLTIHHFKETADCLHALREKGYRIVATSPSSAQANTLSALPLDQKTALIFGTERQGLSDYALSNADALVTIPMVGFTESLNISVSAAICMHDLRQRLLQSDSAWQLTEEEKIEVLLEWMRVLVKHSPELEQRFLQNQP